jgi:hypothetical protein
MSGRSRLVSAARPVGSGGVIKRGWRPSATACSPSAITLLVIELRPPEVHAGQPLAQALWQQCPQLSALHVSPSISVPIFAKMVTPSAEAVTSRTTPRPLIVVLSSVTK